MNEIPPGKCHSLTFPRLTVLVTARGTGVGDKDNAITISWHSPISIQPPLYGISVAFTRASHAMIEDCGEWVVNFIPFSMAREVHYCGRHSGRDVDKLREMGLASVPSLKVAPPRLQGAYAALECRTVSAVPLGDHTWFTGEVVAAHAAEGSFDGSLLRPEVGALLYLGSNTYTPDSDDGGVRVHF